MSKGSSGFQKYHSHPDFLNHGRLAHLIETPCGGRGHGNGSSLLPRLRLKGDVIPLEHDTPSLQALAMKAAHPNLKTVSAIQTHWANLDDSEMQYFKTLAYTQSGLAAARIADGAGCSSTLRIGNCHVGTGANRTATPYADRRWQLIADSPTMVRLRDLVSDPCGLQQSNPSASIDTPTKQELAHILGSSKNSHGGAGVSTSDYMAKNHLLRARKRVKRNDEVATRSVGLLDGYDGTTEMPSPYNKKKWANL